MPYVNNYEEILKENKVDYEIINWDRFNFEENSSLKYRDSKTGHQRSFFDYLKYKKFLIQKLKTIKYDKVIVFGIQLSYFLKGILINNFKSKYLIDIRDYNKTIKYFNMKSLIVNSCFTVVSSQGFKEWLPQSDKYEINHNMQINRLDDLEKVKIDFVNEKINIANIGTLRDLEINIELIRAFKNNDKFSLFYHGEGIINKKLSNYLNTNEIRNVFLTGRYNKRDEESLYKKSDLINVIIPSNHTNSRTLLPNRLYNAVLYGKPMVAFKGTYLSEQINSYNLGLVLDSFDCISDKIMNYLDSFDLENYEEGRKIFIRKVIKENHKFKIKVKTFIRS